MSMVIESSKLSSQHDKRYIVVDKDTGEILDDAQGYGYKTRQGAYRAYGYKTRDKSKDKEKAEKKRIVKQWCKENRRFVRMLEADAFSIAKGSYAPEDEFNAEWVNDAFMRWGFTDLPFTVQEFLRYWGG